MENAEPTISPESSVKKNKFLKTNLPLLIAAALLIGSSFLIGYTVGHRQGLTVVGYDADAEQLVDVVQKQKAALDSVSKSLNAAVQERDMAVDNADELFKGINQANADKLQFENMNAIYRETLRQRGGVSLTIQNLAIKSLPENAFEYQIDLVQVSPNKRRAVGSVELRLIKGTEILDIPLEDKNFNFDDFERLTGRWTMPKGFVPQFIEVRLSGAGTPVIKRFSWQRGAPVDLNSAFVSEIPQAEANAQ
ncbi:MULTISPECIES: DUF6776 family protein [Acinetobacter]|uniref:Uncharacterized protein n=2 Tax=Acinetobacter beijerinckii TaxID=262668 RepID=N9FJK6_9GAMM|nr:MULTISPECIES: DUF6776 family protein [Acinetobacter]ENW05076.1 hypothetical protein F934_01808 [Acinetobacter beijerinckii ANC 3835]ENW07850.1 hypothetical protein F933_01046 [Acinetobacter beijerinckii CIP 110307]MBC9228418.1 hypothetical protein [Acinetobacter baumannii]UTO20988.1 hypothetical protein NGC85_07880 [Acinetobacter sp. Z1]